MEGAYSSGNNVPTMYLSNKKSGDVNITNRPYSFLFATYPNFSILNSQIGSLTSGSYQSSIDVYEFRSKSGTPNRKTYSYSTRYFITSFSNLSEIIYEGPGTVTSCYLNGKFSYILDDLNDYQPDIPSFAYVYPSHSGNLGFGNGFSRDLSTLNQYSITFIIDDVDVVLYDNEFSGNIIQRTTCRRSPFTFPAVYYTIKNTLCSSKRTLLGINYVSSINGSVYHVNPKCITYSIKFEFDNDDVILYDSKYGVTIISKETHKLTQFNFSVVYYTIRNTLCSHERTLLGTNYVSSINGSVYHVNPKCITYSIKFEFDNNDVILYDSEYGGNIISKETRRLTQFNFSAVYYIIQNSPCGPKRQLLGTNFVSSINGSVYYVHPKCLLRIDVYDKTPNGNSIYYYNYTLGNMVLIEKSSHFYFESQTGFFDFYVKNSYCNFRPLKHYSSFQPDSINIINITDKLFVKECNSDGKDHDPQEQESEEQKELNRKYNQGIILGLSISGGAIILIMIIILICCCCGCCD